MGSGLNGPGPYFERDIMKNHVAKVSVCFLIFLMTAFWTFMLTYNVRAVKRSYDQDVQVISMSTVMTAQTDAMFTVSGGPIEIISLFGQCTVLIASAPGNMDIMIDADDGTDYDNDFTVVVDIDTLGAGDVVTFSNAISEGAGTFVANQNAGQTLSWFCPEGVITQTTASTGTGAIEWFMSYRRLHRDAVVIAN